MIHLINEYFIDVAQKTQIHNFETSNGCFEYKKKLIKEPINNKSIIKSLDVFYESYAKELPEDFSEKFMQSILENRPVTIKETIVHKRVKPIIMKEGKVKGKKTE